MLIVRNDEVFRLLTLSCSSCGQCRDCKQVQNLG